MRPLSDIEIQRALGGLAGWSRKGDTLQRTYQFATFPDGIAFLHRVAEVAEAQAHHPDVDVRYTKLVFHLSTHDAGGVTEKDFVLAHAVEALYEGFTDVDPTRDGFIPRA
ncbi:MAG: 4a-hydroxytetrahydrobiopterin dehydratase [Gemmatimonadaceae bacterium]|jgi:4a-hydroxytetrahydrobiopterin dehydratase|nr:4a-hydroxytetrahydrobiopterin dehydratase [Gemmatimonadaceae bacterium]